jgi:PAS domain S-box-containing protein
MKSKRTPGHAKKARTKVHDPSEAALRESEERFRQIFDQLPIGAALVSPDYRFLRVNEAMCHIMGYTAEELVSLRFSDITHPDHLAADLEQVRRLARGEIDQYVTDKRYVRKDGRIVWGHLSLRAVRDAEGHVRYCVPLVEDITLQKRVERLIHTQRDLAMALTGITSLDSGLRLYLDAALALSETDVGGVYLLDRTSGALDLVVHQGVSAEFVSKVSHFEADSANIRLVMAGKPVYSEYPGVEASVADARRSEGLLGIAVVPIHHEGRVIGCLNVASHTADHLPPFAHEAIETIAAQMGGAIAGLQARDERASYEAKLKSLTSRLALAEEGERRRIAVGVHDDIGQRLVLAKLELQSLRQTIRQRKAVQGIDHVSALIDQTMQDAHSLAFELSNPVLYEVGFAAAIESWLTRQVGQKADIVCDFASELEGTKLDESAAVVLFQAVREVLTNVVKHARARHVKVRVHKVKDEVQVVVEDDGVGLDPAVLDRSADPQRGLGLFNVKERLEYLMGRVEIHSSPGQGTTVTLAAPFRTSDRDRSKAKEQRRSRAESREPKTRT